MNVIATESNLEAKKTLRDLVYGAWLSLVNLGLAEGAINERLYFKMAVDDALATVDFKELAGLAPQYIFAEGCG